VEILLARVKKAHSREKLENEDYQLLKIADKLPKTFYLPHKENLFMLTNPQSDSDKKSVHPERPSLRTKYTSQTLTHNKSSSILLSDKANTVKLPRCPSGTLSPQLTAPATNSKKLRFNNIIIIKGRTITKREIFDLRDYFDKLSSGKECILIEDFI
jgi:hypothetical protein